MKFCSKCQTHKPKNEFSKDKSRKDGLDNKCKSCAKQIVDNWRNNNLDKHRKYAAKWREKNKDKIHDYNLKHKRGMPLGTYPELYKLYGGKCAICSKSEDAEGRRLSIDHDHKTGKVRGLLCHTCNSALGLLKEEPYLFCMALSYLEHGGFTQVLSK